MKTLTITRGISVDGKTLHLTDATETYGTELPARNALALVHYILYKYSDGSQEIITPEVHSPLDVVTFNIDVEGKDGIYYAIIFALPLYESGPLNDGDIVYNTNTNSPAKMISGVLTDVNAADLVGEDVDYGEANSKVDVQLTIYRDRLELIATEKMEAAQNHVCELDEYNVAKMSYDYVELMRAGAHIQFCTGLPVDAQQKIETGIAFAKKALNED